MRQHYLIYLLFLILALQLYTKRSYTTLYPEKKKKIDMYTRQQKYTNNNNRQGENRGE